MRPATPNDIPWMVERYRNRSDSSYVILSSIHGYSESELRSMLSDASSMHVMKDADTEGLLLSVHDVDTIHGQARIQLCAEGAGDELAVFLRQLMQIHGIRRLTSYAFPHEDCEIRILTGLGFIREAVFREHIFLAGGYSDVLVYALLEGR